MGFKIKRSITNWKHGVLTRYIEEPGVYDVVIPDGVVEIGDKAFEDCKNIKRIVIPDGVTTIGTHAFNGCFSLTSIIIPDSVTKIGKSAFFWCTDLTDITIPDSVTEIGADAFHHCTSLTSIAIPSGVTVINENVFSECESLSHVAIPNGVTLIDTEAFLGCTSLEKIDLPASVVEFGCSVFVNCASLSSVVIPDGISVIYIDTFSGCSNLTSVVIPDSVTEIRQTAFKGCEKLASIVIPDSVAEIQKSAFEGCKKLTIIASAGSYAHTFARQNGIPFEEKAEIPHVEGNEENEPTVEVQKTVNPDGSYVEAIIDHRNNSGVINEYDAQGNLLRTTYGTFVDRPEIPDVELDEYADSFPLAKPMPFTPDSRAERKVFLFIQQDSSLLSFDTDSIYIGPSEKGVFFSPIKDDRAIVLLCYDTADELWYVVSLDKGYSVWLNGIRLRPGSRYFIPAINTIDIRHVTRFAVEYLPDFWQKPMDVSWYTQLRAVEALEDYSRCASRSSASELFSLITTMPLYSWVGIHFTGDGSESAVYIPPIPARIDPAVRYDTNYLNDIQYREDLDLLLPLFTSEEEACKGGTNLSAFLYDYPLPMFQLIMKTGRGVIIDPFSDHAQILSGDSLKRVWNTIREQNYLDDCPDPCWVKRTIL